jgi:hypothetical protein
MQKTWIQSLSETLKKKETLLFRVIFAVFCLPLKTMAVRIPIGFYFQSNKKSWLMAGN